MTNRREFLRDAAGATAGIFFTGCGLVDSALGAMQAGGVKRRQVTVGGRRVQTIDVHAHIRVSQVWELVKDTEQGKSLEEFLATPDPEVDITTLDLRIAEMDRAGIDVQAVSIGRFNIWNWADRNLADRIVQLQNEKIGELCAARPDRFVGLASIAMQHPDLAAQQLDYAVKNLRLRGCAITTDVNGDELSDPKFHPFWAKAEQLGAFVFIHPQGFREGARRFRGNGNLGNSLGSPMATAVALSHLIQDGTLDRFPELKICGAHGGGFLPASAGRQDQCQNVFRENCKPLKKKPSEYIRQIYFDTVVFTGEALRHLVATVGAGQVVLGTDYQSEWNRNAVDHILSTPALSDADRRAILGGNAARLLRIGA
ncbi:MAG: hypothetical protein A3H28_15875 [Acidobacteria bacterium RIFCSPLOWO2_02_FULL_61_28]|nr:MAG: hypothetical protein A3H28_15875 [Acidobacteria bacterium RIFCSPLOWO2_02_FULL_61_28]